MRQAELLTLVRAAHECQARTARLLSGSENPQVKAQAMKCSERADAFKAVADALDGHGVWLLRSYGE